MDLNSVTYKLSPLNYTICTQIDLIKIVFIYGARLAFLKTVYLVPLGGF